MKFKNWMEGSYELSDIPDRFFLVGYFDSKYHSGTANQLANFELNGVFGISGDERIIKNFFGERDMLLVMDGNALQQANSLSRVMYDNPEYLVSKNMSALLRIWAYTERTALQNMDSVYSKLMQYFALACKRLTSGYPDPFARLKHAITYDGGRHLIKARPNNVNNTWDLAKWLQKEVLKKYNGYWDIELELQQAKQIIDIALKEIGKIYHDEGEWLVKQKDLKVPQDSELFLVPPNVTRKVWSDYILNGKESYSQKPEEMGIFLQALNDSKLTSKYKVRYVSYNDVQENRSSLNYDKVVEISKTSMFAPEKENS